MNGKVTSNRNNDTVTIKAENYNGSAYLLLRTHGEEIYEMTGGSYKKVEEDAYLLTLTDDSARIKLKSKTSLYYSD